MLYLDFICRSFENFGEWLFILSFSSITFVFNLTTIWIYVWLGTCDLTPYNKKCISISSYSDEKITVLSYYYNKIGLQFFSVVGDSFLLSRNLTCFEFDMDWIVWY
jgi:hypothetical protein